MKCKMSTITCINITKLGSITKSQVVLVRSPIGRDIARDSELSAYVQICSMELARYTHGHILPSWEQKEYFDDYNHSSNIARQHGRL